MTIKTWSIRKALRLPFAFLIITTVLLARDALTCTAVAETTAAQTPVEVWKDYDPNKGDFKEEVVRAETRQGIFYRDSYISAYAVGEEIRVFCKYAVKAGAVNAPGLLNVHGWMATANIDQNYVNDGWAVMSFDYCGKTKDRKDYTRYPESLSHGAMTGPVIHDSRPGGKSITDPKQSSEYLWYAIQSRVVSYLEQQKEVDRGRIGAKGYSYGGTLMWALATDRRIKAVVAYFGIGWIEYYRNKQVWMYNNPYLEPRKSPGEEIFLASMSPEAYVPYITAPTLWLNGSNDHHGGHERSLESFKRFKPGVPCAFAVQARGHHNTDKIEQDSKMWLEKHVLKKEVFWPAQPKSEIKLNWERVPELVITPDSPEKVKKVEMWYSQKNPFSFTRVWRDVPCVKSGRAWVGQMPVLNVNDYVFGYGNVTYDTTVVLSTFFNAAIPSRLGDARATDKPVDIYTGAGGLGAWSNVAEVEGVGGIKGFRPTNNSLGTGTESLADPKWKSPAGARLGFKFYCTQPQTLVLLANDKFEAEIEITANDNWQEMAVKARQLKNRSDKRPLDDWAKVEKIGFMPKAGSDLTKVIFSQFKWVD